MTPDQDKNLERLARAVETTFHSPWRTFWRGFLWGLGRGLGATIGLAIVLAIGFYILNALGVIDNFSRLFESFQESFESFDSLRAR